MPDKDQAVQLQLMIEDVKEHLSYLNELGVNAIDPLVSNSTTSTNPNDQAVTKPKVTGLVPRDSLWRKALAAETVSEVSPIALFDPTSLDADTSLSQPNETLEDVWRDTQGCTRCPLWEGRTNVVNSEGDRKAQLMFVGEAPGADEDAQARPFVGRAGQLLHKIIESIGLKRDEVFIGNVNRCRPPQNRTPTQAEGATCKPFILREIDIVQPKVIVVLGNVAMKNLLDTKEGITKVRGKFQDYRGIKVMPTFHPAYLLRDPSKKRETWEDMKKVRDFLSSTSD